MRVLIQRVSNAKVEISGKEVSSIGNGLLVFLGVANEDTDAEIEFLVEKIINLRIFEDEHDKMNKSLLDVKGDLLVVSQFTLYADCKKGRRPSFIGAAAPEFAKEMYIKFIQRCKLTGLRVGEGEFGAMMDVSLTNAGPVTIWMDSKE